MTAPLPRSVAALLVYASLVGSAAAQESSPAQAPSARRTLPIAIALTPNAEAHSAAIAQSLEAALARSPRHALVDPVTSFDPPGLAQRQLRATQGDDAMRAGQRAYEALEENLGLEWFDRAMSSYEQAALWDHFDDLVAAWVRRILIRWSDDSISTRREVQRLVSLKPDVKFPPDMTPPDLQQELERARDMVRVEPKFSLDVRTDPVSARVYVNGEYRGTTPVSVRGLPQGEHYLTLIAPGYEMVQQKVRAGPGSTSTVTLKVADRARPFLTFIDRMRAGFNRDDEVTAARVLGRVTRVEELLVAGVSRQNSQLTVHLHRIDVSDGHVSHVSSFEVPDSSPQLVPLVERNALLALSQDRPRKKDGSPEGIRSEVAKTVDAILDVPQEHMRLALGISSAALVATGVTFGVIAGMRSSEYNALAQTDPARGPLADSGRAMAITADVLTGVGLVAGATWAWLQFGQPFSQRTDLVAPPVLEQQPREDERRRRSREDDPFLSRAAPVPSAAPTVSALHGGAYVGVLGSF